MFIACLPYKMGVDFSRIDTRSDNILIFDTEDISLEYISYTELYKNIETDSHGTSLIGSSVLNNYDFLQHGYALRKGALSFYVEMACTHNLGKVSYSIIGNFNTYTFDGYKFAYNNSLYRDKTGKKPDGTVIVVGGNHYFLARYKGIEICYVFKYRDLLVLRCNFGTCFVTLDDLSSPEEKVISFAITKLGRIASIWDLDGNCLMGDKALGIKIDTLHKY